MTPYSLPCRRLRAVTLGMSREDFDAPGVRGHLRPGLGVAVLVAEGDLETPDRFERGDGDRLVSVMLLLDDQRCGS